jgi:ribosomal protein RSM22 (predicted rRNA methylase)
MLASARALNRSLTQRTFSFAGFGDSRVTGPHASSVRRLCTGRLGAGAARLPENIAPNILRELTSAFSAGKESPVSIRELRRALFDTVTGLSPAYVGHAKALALLAWKAPGHYAALRSVLLRLSIMRPAWSPKHILDIASTSGGMGIVAAQATWPSTKLDAVLLHSHLEATAACQTWLRADTKTRSYLESTDDYDLITAVHCRSDGGAYERSLDFFEQLWMRCRGMLVIIEPGCAEGFARMEAVRSHLLQRFHSSVKVAAPCPHSGPCPLSTKHNTKIAAERGEHGYRHNFCHFAQRYHRDPSLKAFGALDREGKRMMPSHRGHALRRYAYVALERVQEDDGDDAARAATQSQAPPGRILREPLRRGGHVVMHVCQRNGQIEQHTYTRRKHADGTYQRARHAAWGDEWDASDRDAACGLADAETPLDRAGTNVS